VVCVPVQNENESERFTVWGWDGLKVEGLGLARIAMVDGPTLGVQDTVCLWANLQ
jgi:hypothetical protein